MKLTATLLLAVFTVACLQVQAQLGKFKVGMSGYFNYSDNILIVEPGFEEIADVIDGYEVAKPSFSTSFFFSFGLNKNLSISLGFGYMNTGERTKKLSYGDFVFPVEIDPFYGFVKPSGDLANTEIRSIYNLHFLEFPVQLKYSFYNNYYVQTGPSMLLAISQSSSSWRKTEGERAKVSTRPDNSTDFKNTNFAMNFGVGRTFKTKSTIEYFVGLNGQYIFESVAESVPINRKYYSAGVVAGVLF